MSTKRRLRRARAKEPKRRATPSAAGNEPLPRTQTEEERFKRAGSDKLWPALLGWDHARRARAWLTQAVHDGARWREQHPHEPGAAVQQRVGQQVLRRCPELEGRLELVSLETAVELWLGSGDDYAPEEPAPKWPYLANLCGRLGLGEPTPETLQDDWETFTSLTLASAPRQALMEALAQTEHAALSLDAVTRSDNIQAVATVTRILWSAIAYGDEDTFARLRDFSAQWLSRSTSAAEADLPE